MKQLVVGPVLAAVVSALGHQLSNCGLDLGSGLRAGLVLAWALESRA